jgi:hypothetical protein
MPPLTTETALNILIDWLQDNIIFDNIIFDNDEDTDSAALLPWIEQALRMFAIRHLQLLQQASTD